MNFRNVKSYLRYQLSSARVARRGFLKGAGGAVLGSSFLGCSSESQQAASPPSVMPSNRGKKAAHLVRRKVVYEHNEKYQWNGCGAIVATEKALVMSWYTGGVKEPTTDNLVVWNRSLDRGKTWSEPVEISNPPGLVRAADPMLWRDSKGVVHFTYATNDMSDMTPETIAYRFVRHTCSRPAAEKLTWSAAIPIEPQMEPGYTSVFFNNKPIQLDNGDWLIPLAFRTQPIHGKGPHHWGFAAAGAMISSDDMKTWKCYHGPDFEQSPYGPKDMTVWEPGAYQRGDGTVVMYFRTNWGILHATYSTDRGRTWSDYEPTVIVNPNSRMHVRKLPDGPVICLTNANAYPSGGREFRRFLSMYISYDDGHSFTRLVILDVDGQVMYPDADLDPDGHTLHIFYENRKDIFYAPLDLREVV